MRNLRDLSIKAVENVVLWRDAYRNLALMGTKQRNIRKKRAQTAIQIPFLTNDNTNYLLKMKYDTLQLSALPIAKYYNLVQESSRGDPFLIHASVAGNIIVGKKVGAMRKGKDMIKRVLPLQEGDMTKAKACEEMIFYEQPPVQYDQNG